MPDFVVSGTDGFDASIDALLASINTQTEIAMSLGAETIVRSTRLQFGGQHAAGTARTIKGPRPQSISENLKNSVSVVDSPNQVAPGQWKARVAPTMIYSRIMEKGGTIYPKNASMLSWVGPGGKRIFARSVTLPPRPYLGPGVEKSKEAISVIFRERWAQALIS